MDGRDLVGAECLGTAGVSRLYESRQVGEVMVWLARLDKFRRGASTQVSARYG